MSETVVEITPGPSGLTVGGAEVSSISFGRQETHFKCHAGHEVQSEGEPFSVKTEGIEPAISSGPLCPVCYVLWMAAHFPTVRVEKADAD